MYNVPEQYYIRLHHVRPRFKGDIENVLIYMAREIVYLSEMKKEEFKETLNHAIMLYPGNMTKKIKTINNWRTEISSLFGFFYNDGDITYPGYRSVELAENEDLVEFFKTFLFTFQYPGAHIKSHENLVLIQKGVAFKPAQKILSLLKYAECVEGKRIGITKAEICHCIFNDLRCVRDKEEINETWDRIKQNREYEVEYDTRGDIIRYAGDIVDYMEIANLLKSYDGRVYYTNKMEEVAIQKFIDSQEWFTGYDSLLMQPDVKIQEVNEQIVEWFVYVNRKLDDTDFSTDVISLLADNLEEAQTIKTNLDYFLKRITNREDVKTKDIGDIGESLIHGHESQRVKIGGREDLIHLIKKIPTQFAVGYDIQSVELDERKRYIEVKTTISSKALNFNKVHLTPNEWRTADTLKDRYFIYRLMISKHASKLFFIQDPVGKYKEDKLSMLPRDGADITFDVDSAGMFEELLLWEN